MGAPFDAPELKSGDDGGEDVALAHDHEGLTVDLDLIAGVLAEEDAVALCHSWLANRAVVEPRADANGDDESLEGLLLR